MRISKRRFTQGVNCFVLIFSLGVWRFLNINKHKNERFNAFFMEDSQDIHIGHIIHETLKTQGRSVAWLARELNYTRENMYNIFKSPRIDTDTLLKISLALNKNFFLLYVDFYKKRKEKITEM